MPAFTEIGENETRRALRWFPTLGALFGLAAGLAGAATLLINSYAQLLFPRGDGDKAMEVVAFGLALYPKVEPWRVLLVAVIAVPLVAAEEISQLMNYRSVWLSPLMGTVFAFYLLERGWPLMPRSRVRLP